MHIAFYYITTHKVLRPIIYNEGIAVLSALARKAGASSSLQRIDLTDLQTNSWRVEPEADIHAVSFPSQQASVAQRVIRKISQSKTKGLIVVGGVHATVCREDVIAMEAVDLVVSGEGETCFQWLLDHPGGPLSSLRLPNCHVRGRAVEPLVKTDYVDINALPLPDRSIFEKPLLRERPEFIFSRGCPFSCAYCINEFINNRFGFKLRRKSPEYALAELEDAFSLLDIAKDTVLTFHDDVFLLDEQWLEEFAQGYMSRFNNPFRCNTIASAVSRSKVQLLKQMNCQEVWIGLESGDEQYRRQVLRKNVSDKVLLDAFAMVREAGLMGVSFNLFGCPGESLEHVRRTYELNKRCAVGGATTAIFYPFPGTQLHAREVANGNLRELTDEENDRGVSVFALKKYSVNADDYTLYARLLYDFVNGLHFESATLRAFHALGINLFHVVRWCKQLRLLGDLVEKYKQHT